MFSLQTIFGKGDKFYGSGSERGRRTAKYPRLGRTVERAGLANAIKWIVGERMVWAWILTLPVTGGIAWLLVEAARTLGLAR